jgi:hypothetical protein
MGEATAHAKKSKPDRFLEDLDDLERQWLATGGIDRTSQLLAKPRCLAVHMILPAPGMLADEFFA